MKNFEKINTQRLILRPLCPNDLIDVNDYSANTDNTKYITSPNRNLEETQDYLTWVSDEWNQDSPKYYGFAIILNDKLIGEIAFGGESGTSEVSIGWIIHKDFWNFGYATEAVKAIVNLCFNTMGINKIIAECDIENIATRHIMEKIGMKLKCENERWEYRDGRISKAATYYLDKRTE